MRIGGVSACQPSLRLICLDLCQNQILRRRHAMDAGPLAVQEVNGIDEIPRIIPQPMRGVKRLLPDLEEMPIWADSMMP